MAENNHETKTPEVSPVSATDPAVVLDLIKELSALGENFNPADVDENLRLDLALKARTLWKALETPRETMIRHCWGQVSCQFHYLQLEFCWTYTSFLVC